MKLLMIMIRDEDREQLLKRMLEQGFTPTYIASTGDFLQFGKSIFMLGIEEERVEEVKHLVKTYTKKSFIKDGEQLRAQIFVLNAEIKK